MIGRFTRGVTYVRIRLVFGVLFILLGALVGIRTFSQVGFDGKAIPSYVLALAMIALGFFRLRTYFQIRAQQR